MAEKKGETSKNILAVVLVIIIFVSILGTWTVLSMVDKAQTQQVIVTRVVDQGGPVTGQITLEILPAKDEGESRG